MRELAYIQTIKSLSPIPGADQIEKAEVLGWECVVKKGDFKVGDLCVYVEIDAILPELPCFEFLRPRKFRVRTIKLKSQVSQGLVLPLSMLLQIDPTINIAKLKVGKDMTEVLRITKYDPEALLDSEQPKKTWFDNKISFIKWKIFGIKPIRKGNFPSDVPKTDEERVQKMHHVLSDRIGQPAYITEKIEGTSSTFIYRKGGGNWLAKLFGQDGAFQVCTRNRILYNSRNGKKTIHFLCDVADKYGVHQQLAKLNRNLAVQAECIGPKIQANIYRLPEHELRVFLIWDIDKQAYLPYDEMVSMIKQMGLTMVPVVDEKATLTNDIKYYVELSKGKSAINPKVLREGIVVRSLDDNFSFKSINPEYLLKQD